MPHPSQSDQQGTSGGRCRLSWPTRGWAVRIGAAIAVGLCLAVAISVVQALLTRHLLVGLDSLWWFFGGAMAAAIATGALVLWLRPRRRTLAVAAAAVLAAGLAACAMFRLDGFYGNLFPRVVWRWSPTAEQRLAAYQQRRAQSGQTLLGKLPPGTLAPTEHDHPGFLGAGRDGVVRGVHLDRDWRARPPRELWRHPVGRGWGSFAVVGDFAVTQEQRGPQETIVCYDVRSGRERWTHGDAVRFSGPHGDGPRATPTIAAGRVYAIGATGLLTCLDGATGRLIWQQKVLPNPDEGSQSEHNLSSGMAGSPLVVGDLVIVSPGGAPGRAVLALHAGDGSLAWSGGDDPAAYSSPMLVSLGGVRQILSFNGAGLRGVDAANGNPLWLHPWVVTQGEKAVNIAQPLMVAPFGPPAWNAGCVLVSSGYGLGVALLRVTRENGAWRTAEVWRNKNLKSKMSNFVVLGQNLYGLDDGVLVCLDVRDGRRLWKRGRYGHGQMLLVKDLLLIQAEGGDVVLVEATPDEHRELAKLKAMDDKTWNHPTLAGRVLLVRNDNQAVAYELPGRVASPVSAETATAGPRGPSPLAIVENPGPQY